MNPETHPWKGNGLLALWLIKIMKYNISFVLCSHNACSCSEICLCFYFDMNYYFSLDGSVATQAQGQLPSHDRTGELGESISHRTAPPDLNPGCLCGEYNWQSNSTRHFPFMWAVVEQLELSLFCCWDFMSQLSFKKLPQYRPFSSSPCCGKRFVPSVCFGFELLLHLQTLHEKDC